MEGNDGVDELKRRLSASFDEMTQTDVCYDIKDVLVEAVKTT